MRERANRCVYMPAKVDSLPMSFGAKGKLENLKSLTLSHSHVHRRDLARCAREFGLNERLSTKNTLEQRIF